jgi:hypothetical protein
MTKLSPFVCAPTPTRKPTPFVPILPLTSLIPPPLFSLVLFCIPPFSMRYKLKVAKMGLLPSLSLSVRMQRNENAERIFIQLKFY